MARQKTKRPAKRHLVRWNDEMDKRLLLTLQSVCNSDGIRLPWDKVGVLMGDQISDGAVIQHLAKLRQRMVAAGLEVPPPLRRGGGIIISTRASGIASAKNSATSKKTKNKKRAESLSIVDESDGDEEDVDEEESSDSDDDFGRTQSKRMKRKPNKKVRETKIKSEDGEEYGEQTSYLVGNKRKRGKNVRFTVKEEVNNRKTKPDKMLKSKLSAKIALARRAKAKSSVTEANDSDEDIDEESDSDIIVDDERGIVPRKKQYVAAGADFLQLDESETSSQDKAQAKNDDLSNKRGVVVFKFGNSERAKSLLGGFASKDEVEDAEAESVYDYDTDDSDDQAVKSLDGYNSDESNGIDQAAESINSYNSDGSSGSDGDDQAAEEATEDIASTDAHLDFSINVTDANEPLPADNHQDTYGDVSFAPSIGRTYNNFSVSNDIRGSSTAFNIPQGESHFPYNGSFQQFNHLDPGYSESARQEGYFGGSAVLDQNVNSGCIASSDAQTVEYPFPGNSTHPRSIDVNWNLQPGFNHSYFPLANQHSAAAPEAFGRSNHLPYSHTASVNQLTGSNDLIPSISRGMARSDSYHNEQPQNINQLPITSYGIDTKYNILSTPNQQEYFPRAQRSLTSPLPMHVPQQASYPGVPTDNFSATTTNLNQTPWTTSPVNLDGFGTPIGAQQNEINSGVSQQEGPSGTHDYDFPFDEYLMSVDELDDVFDAHFNDNHLDVDLPKPTNEKPSF